MATKKATRAPARSKTGSARPTRAAKTKGVTARPAKPAKPARPGQARGKSRPLPPAPDVVGSDPNLFAPLTPGEAADALRTLTEDRRVTGMAKVGRYRVIATEPLVVKPPHWMAGHRLVRVVVYDYAADKCVDACVDLDAGVVTHLDVTPTQPMLSREEEAVAMTIATSDDGVRTALALGDEPQVAMHYWGKDPSDLAYTRRSAAVVFGRPGSHPSVVAVVDLLDNTVTAVVPAAEW